MSKKKFQYDVSQKNKFLDDLGIKPHNYGVNFTYKKDKRKKKWEKERKKYGFDSRETWNLNTQFVEWLYSHLKMYLKEASKIVDLSYYKFTFNEQEYTQEEAIKYIINACEEYLLFDDESIEAEEHAMTQMQNAMKLWIDIFPCMWW